MLDTFFKRLSHGDPGLKGRVIAIYILLLAATVLAWIWAYVALHDQPVLMSTALLAYTFGLRHAVDADHIAAIDNVTRKLMRDANGPSTRDFSSRSGTRQS